MNGLVRFPRPAPRLGGPPPTVSTTAEVGYPWVDGDLLYSADLNAAVAYSASVYYLANFGAKTDGVTDDSAALNAAIAAAIAAGGGKIVLPAGRTVLCSSIAASIPAGVTVTIEGMGSGVSELYFDEASDGLSFMMLNSGSAWGAVHLFDFMITRGPTSPTIANTGLHLYADPTALKMNYVAMSLRGLTIWGSSPLGNQWLNSMVISGLSGCSLEHVFLLGCNATNVDQGDALLTIDGPNSSQYCGGMVIVNCTFQGGSAGVNVTNYVQGISIANCIIIGQYDSIRWISSSTFAGEELAVTNCSLNGGHRGIYTSAVTQSSISNTTVLRLINSTASYAGIEMDQTLLCSIVGCNVIGQNAANETGIILSNCGPEGNTIIGNTFSNLGQGAAIHLSGNTTGALVVGNAIIYALNAIVQDTTGNYLIGNTWAGTPVGVSPYLTVNGAVFINTLPGGSAGQSIYQTGGLARWFVGGDGTAESGSNSGSNYEIVAAADSGTTILGAALNIARSNGAVVFSGWGGGDYEFALRGSAGTNRFINLQSGLASRWFMGAQGTPETGTNAGSDFAILSCNDNGTLRGTPISISRATSEVTIQASLAIGGSMGVWGATLPTSKPTVTGAKGGNTALASFIAAMASYGFVIDATGA